jgi:2-polyprenyl-3-methyl-5-hydroxy-6-metoxy-1,4-benzoquinol methylase
MYLEFTGERIVPGHVTDHLFAEHENRYVFAARFVAASNVLDVACGTGIGTEFLFRSGAASCTGMDIDPIAVQHAISAYDQCKFIACDATKMPVQDGSFDVIVSFETIEHLPDPVKFLKECSRVLRPGGTLVCSTPNLKVSQWGPPNPFHVREYTTDEFTDLLKSSNFDVSEMYSQGDVLYPMFVARRMTSKLLGLLGVKSVLRKLLHRKPATLTARSAFEAASDDQRIRLFRRTWSAEPTFVIAVAQKRGI